jgi:DNA-binding LytR/AlgR family response regulator
MIGSEYLANQHMEYKIDGFRSGEEFTESDHNMEKYDIVFMDINMDNIDGIEAAKIMRKVCPNTFLIFVTAFINYTLEGYKVEAIRYILKDYETLSENIEEALDTVIAKINVKTPVVIYNFVEDGVKKVPLSQVMYIENKLHKISFHLMENGEENIYNIYKKINEIESDFESEDFVRVHQSFLVNMKYVCSVKRYLAKLQNGTEVPISKQRFKLTVETFIRQKGEI